jgi:hypothetical protein
MLRSARTENERPRKERKEIMRQTTDALESETPDAVFRGGKNAEGAALNATVYVYGHGSNKNPFYEEARAVNATEKGGLLLLSASVNRGQKLLLMNSTRQDPVEAQVVRTRTMGTQMFEVEVAFFVPRPDFWQPFSGAAKGKGRAEKRRFPRVVLLRGMTVAWQATNHKDISRVSSLSLGGLFIEAANPAPAGDTLQVQFDIPSGAVRGQAVVRRSIKGKGMGVEFTELPAGSRDGLSELLQKLLGHTGSRKS